MLEEQLRENLIISLRTTRAKSGELSRSLREQELVNASLKVQLEEEHLARIHLETELARIASINTTLLEHNGLLASRDSALQDDITTLMASKHHPCTAIEETSESPTITRQELVSAQDDLFLTEQHLLKSQRQCTELSNQVTHLQENLATCMDESGRALELERELRRDVEAKVHQLLSEMAEMRRERDALRDELHIAGPLADAWKKKIGFSHVDDSPSGSKRRKPSRPLSYSGALQLSRLAEEDGSEGGGPSSSSREHRRYHSQPFNALPVMEPAPSFVETEVNPFDKLVGPSSFSSR